jgi:hypothetical protein
MSTCPHCGAPDGKFHTCRARFQKERAGSQPAPSKPAAAPVVAKKAEAPPAIKKPAAKPKADPKVAAAAERLQAVADGKRKKLTSHPDCEVCKRTRERVKAEMRKRRGTA